MRKFRQPNTKERNRIPYSQMPYDVLMAAIKALQAAGKLPKEPTQEQRASWAYGQTKLENELVTREDAAVAAEKRKPT